MKDDTTQWGATQKLLEEKDQEIALLKSQLEVTQAVVDEIMLGGID